MIKRTLITLKNALLNRRKKYLRAYGCPVSVGDHVHYLSTLGGIRNMNFHPKLMLGVNLAYIQMRIYRFLNRYLT